MKESIIQQTLALNLPLGEYVVVSGGVLSVHELRPHNDIDILVSQSLYDQLKETEGWRTVKKGDTYEVLMYKDTVEAFRDFAAYEYYPDIPKLIARADIIDGVPFSTLKDLLEFKKVLGREKDLRDIVLVEGYIEKNKL